MSGNSLTMASSLKCPHGAPVQITSANPMAMAGGAAIVTANDVFTVIGCPFQLPTVPPTPSPCVTVKWSLGDLRVKSSQGPTLSQSSQGLCYSALQAPQGPVVIEMTQPKVSSA